MLLPRFWHGAAAAVRHSSSLSKLRNIGIIAHIDAGKTTTTERMLYYSGFTKHLGNVDTGDTVTDFLPAERARGITIMSAAVTLNWADHRINLIDTPGHADFTFEVIRSMRVLDGAVTILDAVAGVEAQTEKVWKQADEWKIPRIVYVNKMDRPGAGFGRTVKEISLRLGATPAIVTLPYFEGDMQFKGIVDIIEKKLLVWNGENIAVSDVLPDNALYEELCKARAALVDTLSMNDEVMDAFLADEDPINMDSGLLRKALRECTLDRTVTPVLCGSSFRNIGVQNLLDAVIYYLPDPMQAKTAMNESIAANQAAVKLSKKHEELSALAFKVTHDEKRGYMVFVRVYAGRLARGSQVHNATTKKTEKVSTVFRMYADDPQSVPAINEGDIGVIMGSDSIRTGDTLSRTGKSSVLPEIPIPEPVFMTSLMPESIAAERAMHHALEVLLKEDPSLRTSTDTETGQLLLSGMGELHLEIALSRLRDLKADVSMGQIEIAYKESISGPSADVSHVSGPAEAIVAVEPATEDTASMKNVYKLSDENYLAIENVEALQIKPEAMSIACNGAVSTALLAGGLGLPVHGCLVRVKSIKLPDDCTDMTAINTSIRLATVEALHSVRGRLLEPIMQAEISIEETHLGAVLLDLAARDGHIEDLEDTETYTERRSGGEMYLPPDITMHMSQGAGKAQKTVRALVPLRTMIGYLKFLRSTTQGRGNYTMQFQKYSETPHECEREIIESRMLRGL
ncbi:hypothetical protein CANCADRAFT_3250 [Tortispora caseinolytica NRRL Y-17796]|uniref:Tr-type G domain-containing protein n=1 Tax=Tortispora caseinolytica NRRL Y-17796 TaxID=767744 RepID=A0A1E4T9Z5_9ASCO|nr:hypothetical protein CANCADRAFT_3250 [Tortispora caseinolytica NRRL Y-17796]